MEAQEAEAITEAEATAVNCRPRKLSAQKRIRNNNIKNNPHDGMGCFLCYIILFWFISKN